MRIDSGFCPSRLRDHVALIHGYDDANTSFVLNTEFDMRGAVVDNNHVHSALADF